MRNHFWLEDKGKIRGGELRAAIQVEGRAQAEEGKVWVR